MNSPAPWHLISTRPARLNAALSNAVVKAGGHFIPLESMDIEPRLGEDTVTRLLSALRSPCVIFTSPTAVDIASEVLDLQGALNRRTVLATGAGTQKALVNRGVRQTRAPERMDSEGLLAMDALAHVQATALGLVTGEGGRGLLQPTLEARGAMVRRADVYARVPRDIPADEWARVRSAAGRRILAVTSAEAFDTLWRQVPQDLAPAQWGLVAASSRLAAMLPAENTVRIARSPMPLDLVEAARSLLQH